MSVRRVGSFVAAISIALVTVPGPTVLATVSPCGVSGSFSNPSAGVYSCDYTTQGADTFTVPPSITGVDIYATGGKGGHGFYQGNNSGRGGLGVQVYATVPVTPNWSLDLYVASNGADGTQPSGGTGGLNGPDGTRSGGTGGTGGSGASTQGGGGGGGGASTVYHSTTPLVVAAGGGGGADSLAASTVAGSGGNAGKTGSDGYDGEASTCNGGGGGTASAGGAGGNGTDGVPLLPPGPGACTGGSGSSGGSPANSSGGTGGNGIKAGGGGGGGGYYGGGGGAGTDLEPDAAGGGGGSSYSVDTNSTYTPDNSGNPTITIRWSLPGASVYGYVKDVATNNDWNDTEEVGSEAYGHVVLGVATGLPTPTGNVTFNFYAGNSCSGSPAAETKSLGVDGTADSSDTPPLPVGNHSLEVDYAGDSNYAPSSSSCSPFTVLKHPNAINYTSSPPAVAVVGGTYTPTATATSGLTVHFKVDASSGSGVCALGSGKLSFSHVGTCVLDANQAGDSDYGIAPQQQQTISVWPQSGGTITRSVAYVPAGATGTTIAFTFKAPAGGVSKGTVQLKVPDGWSAPSKTGTAPGFTTVSAGNLSIAADGRTIVVKNLTLGAGASMAIIYGFPGAGGPGATVTTTTGAATWAAKELSTTVGTAAALAPAPTISVVAADGSGLLTANKTSVKHGSVHQTVKFTYTVWPGGMRGGKLTLTVPGGWSAPSLNSSAAGYVTIAGAGAISIGGPTHRTITISGITLSAGKTFVITYGSRDGGGPGAATPLTVATQTWNAKEQSLAKSTLTPLSVSPKIKVN